MTLFENYFTKFLKYMREHGLCDALQQSYIVLRNKVLKPLRHAQYASPTIKQKQDCLPNKGVVYTCIVGNYDTLPQYCYQDLHWDYVCFTDNKAWIQKGHIGHWAIKSLQFDSLDSVRNARWHKIYAHKLFPCYQYSLWLDANILVMNADLFDAAELCIANDTVLALPEHPERICVYKELVKVRTEQKEDVQILKQVEEILVEKQYPRDRGLHETNILFRRHTNPICMKLMQDWFSYIENYSRRDQLSFDVVLWENDYTATTLFPNNRTHPRRSTSFHFTKSKKHFSIAKKVKKSETISIIVPIYNALEDVQRCLDSIVQAQLPLYVDIILVNDASAEETKAYLVHYVKEHSNITLLHNEVNSGFIKTCNKGMQYATGDIVVLLNSDTRISVGFAERVLHCFNTHAAIGIASPLSNCTAMWNVPYIEGKNFESMDAHIEAVSLCEYPMLPSPEGFCFCIRREVIDDIGYLDEIFGRGYCEENDFAFRALSQGWQGVLIDNLYVFHKRHASFGKSARKELLQKNQKILWARWKGLYKQASKEADIPTMKAKIHQNIYGHQKNNL